MENFETIEATFKERKKIYHISNVLRDVLAKEELNKSTRAMIQELYKYVQDSYLVASNAYYEAAISEAYCFYPRVKVDEFTEDKKVSNLFASLDKEK